MTNVQCSMTKVLDVDVSADGLRIVFERDGDRFVHRVDVCQDGDFQTVFRSIEGDAHESWPASPPIQEVHLEDRPDGSRVALCVGMAGTSHWSLSALLTADGRMANFDVACRMRDTPEALGSEYELLDLAWMDRIAVTTLDDRTPTTLTQCDDRLLLAPATIQDKSPQTLQWRYTISIP